MPSELTDGSSFLSEQIGFWNTDGVKDGNAAAAGDGSLIRKQRQQFDASSLYLNQITTGRTLGYPLNNNTNNNRPNLGMNHKSAHYENGLFSSSLSDLFTTKLRVSAENNNSSMYGHSVGASRYAAAAEEEPFESLEQIEAQTIGNLLPDDDDLLSGVTDGLLQPGSGADDVEELDFFSSVGGMELGDDERNYETSLEDPSRTLFVRNVSSNMDDSELRSLFEQYGEIQTLYTACKHLGFVMISYYDIRASRRAMQALQNKLLGHTKLDIHYSIPKDKPSDKDYNEGIVSNVRVGGHVGIPAGVSNSFIGVESGGGLLNQQKYDFPNYHPHSLPNGLTNTFSIQCNSPSSMAAGFNGRMSERLGNRQFNRIGGSVNDNVFGNANCSPAATHHYMWNPSQQPHNMIWPGSPSLMNGIGNAHRAPSSHMANAFMQINNHHVGSAPSVNQSIWDRRNSYESLETSSVFHPGSLGNMRVPLDFVSHNIVPPRMELPVPSKSVTHHQNSVMFPSDRTRSRRNESQADNKKQFELDLDCIMRGEDRRTTLMIKNIPNKYTSKMLLAAIDERHRGTYDFIYLPIDFKNKCNVGYAFINMTESPLIVPFYQAFNGKKWEKFNSEKVASIAYARIQGKAALIAHFQNSSLMNEDKRCRPILFHTDGPNAGDQVPFPMGVNVRSRANKNRNEEDHAEASSNSSSGSTKDFQ
ncbi:protein MEI2-like 4 [Bidens hawaiensis]|uniref:protein MEI2-like 4 n=1 Tax=Bidens hawaiensis TaxID=980011 RepID=UPI004049772F